MSKLYLRIISWFLAMVVFAVGVLVFSLFWFSARNERDFSERIQENMRQVDQRISEQYAAINNASVAIMGNKIVQENLRPYSALTVENRYQYAAICSLLLQSRFQLNDFVDSMFLYVDGVRVLYQNGTSESRTFYDKIIQYASYGYDFWISTLDAKELVGTSCHVNVIRLTLSTLSIKKLVYWLFGWKVLHQGCHNHKQCFSQIW